MEKIDLEKLNAISNLEALHKILAIIGVIIGYIAIPLIFEYLFNDKNAFEKFMQGKEILAFFIIVCVLAWSYFSGVIVNVLLTPYSSENMVASNCKNYLFGLCFVILIPITTAILTILIFGVIIGIHNIISTLCFCLKPFYIEIVIILGILGIANLVIALIRIYAKSLNIIGGKK